MTEAASPKRVVSPAQAARKDREAAALRENLRRRKQQGRARDDAAARGAEEDAAGDAACGCSVALSRK